MDPDALDLVPLDDLKAALLRRREHVILAALDDHSGDLSWAWKGDPHTVVGIVEEVKVRMFMQREEAER